MDKMTPGLELPNNQKPENYPQNFVKAPHPEKAGPCNMKAMKAPSLQEVKGTIEKR